MLALLPTELVGEVASHLPLEDVKTFRLINQRFAAVGIDFLLANLSLRFERCGTSSWLDKRLAFVSMLSTPSLCIAERVQRLDVASPFEMPLWDRSPSHARCPDMLRAHLNASIPRMSRLRHFHWKIGAHTPPSVSRMLLSLSRHAPLESMTIHNLGDFPPELPTLHFPSLKKLTFIGKFDHGLARAMCSANPQLQKLYVTASRHIEVDFGFLPRDSALTELSVSGALSIVGLPIERLPYLRTLHIAAFPPVEVQWNPVQAQGIRLDSLQFPEVSDGLLDYLESYHGLRSLDLTVDAQPSDCGKRFWSHVLPAHQRTLEHLSLTLSPELHESHGWNPTPEALQSLRLCESLTSLNIVCDDGHADKVASVLDSIHCWPKMKDLSIEFITAEPAAVPTEELDYEKLLEAASAHGNCTPGLMLGVGGHRYVAEDHAGCLGFRCIDQPCTC